MYLQDAQTHLPAPMRSSKLPWTACCEYQAAAPRAGDGWIADLGHFRFEIEADFEADRDDNTLLYYTLRLFNTHFDREKSSWDVDRLQDAILVAESTHQMLLDSLLDALKPAQKALHDAA